MKYFDKTFFKFTLGFLVIVAISLLIIYAASAYAAGVGKIVFTTDSQSIKPNTLSGPITIQTQDSGGNSFQTPETIDLEFISTSATGEFLSSTGNPATTYMSKNTANRTFYYRDSAEGNFTITVNAIGRDTGGEWSASQQISVSSSASPDNSSGEVSSANTESISSQSATSGAAAPTYSTSNSQLEVSAGGDRLTSPGSPISFQATIKKNSSSNGSVSFSWSFGDGCVGSGVLVSHSYKYPGEYAVVLNASSGDTFAISRLKVKVTEPDISLNSADDYIEISNNTAYEINLFNWKVVSENKGFVFQPDTIILPKSSIKLDKAMLLMKGEKEKETTLKNYLGEIVSSVPVSQPAPIANLALTEIIPESFYIAQAKQEQDKNEIKPEEAAPEVAGEATVDNIIYEASKSEGLLAKLTNFFKRVFSK